MKLSLSTLTAAFSSIAKLNANFTAIKNEFQDKVLYRDNPSGEPNQMENELDMNGNAITNAGAVDTALLRINGVQVTADVLEPVGREYMPAGTAAAPGLYVQGDTDTGLYAPTANQLGVSVAGASVAVFDANGLTADVTAAAITTGDLIVANAPTFSTAFTLPNGTLATTQLQSDDSQKVATTEFVHDAVATSAATKANSGGIGSSGLTMATSRLLGRTTASTGAPEEITVGAGLSLSGGALAAAGLSLYAVCRFTTDTVTTVSGTYDISGTTVTVYKASHTFIVGNWVYLNFTSGTGTDGWYQVVTVPDVDTFTVTHGTSATTSGNVSWYTCNIQYNPSSYIGSITKSASYSHFALNLATAATSSSSWAATGTGSRVDFASNDGAWESDAACVISIANYTDSGCLFVASDNNTDNHAGTIKYGTIVVVGE